MLGSQALQMGILPLIFLLVGAEDAEASCAGGSALTKSSLGMEGRRVLVTGATSGIGRATADSFVALGCQVAYCGRSRKILDEIEDTHRETGRVVTVAADLSDPAECARCVEEACTKMGGGLDVLVNNAGVLPRLGMSIDSTDAQEFDHIFAVNTRAPFLVMQAALRQMGQGGSIVNVGSIAGVRPMKGLAPYSMTKAAIDMFTKCAALEVADRGIRVNAVHPATVVTGIHLRAGMEQAAYDKFLEENKATHPLGRVGVPQDCADAILFLASPASSWITGQGLVLDGGRTLVTPTGSALAGSKP